MISRCVLVALCAQLALSSLPKPALDSNSSPDRISGLSPLENVQALLTHHITGLEALLREITGLTGSSESTKLGYDTFVFFLSPLLLAYTDLLDTGYSRTSRNGG